MEIVSKVKVFGGQQIQFRHASTVLNSDMPCSIYLPDAAEKQAVPVLYWLSGLTCTDQNFVTKAGGQRLAAELGMAIVCPDTSPRGDEVSDDPEGAWDFGLGAGFYVNATQDPWKQHYQMYDYVSLELPALIQQHFNIDASKSSISGHSMGGHGALVVALNNPENYRSVSAFAPICSPMNCPWGEKALSNYLGSDRSQWAKYDACSLIEQSAATELTSLTLPMLVDQGDEDGFLGDQLNTPRLEQVVKEVAYPATIRYQAGYDHSYFFIASFIDEHLRFHHQHLTNSSA